MMHTKQPQAPCTTQCGSIATERNRYFTGKFMAERDFSDEQLYHVSRRWLHNRLMHGWGVVCGLEVTPHTDENCQDRWVKVGSGIAFDCCGRELVLEKEVLVKVWEPPKPKPETGRPAYAQADAPQPAQAAPQPQAEHIPPGPFVLCLRYVEEEIEYVPALYAEGDCDPTRREANRVREVAKVEVCHLDDMKPGCWHVPDGDPEDCCRDDCADQVPGPAGVCLKPECPCGEMVPLALIRPKHLHEAGHDRYVIGAEQIDTSGRHQLPPPRDFLTHIVRINWPHGGQITLNDLHDKLNGQLKVYFDRKLLDADKERKKRLDPTGDAIGVNAFTFVVQYGSTQEDVEFVRPDPDHLPTLENDCVAVFTIDPSLHNPKGRKTLEDNDIYVSLKCDFIMDCHENPVDGDHLRGRLPSGNGTPGGVFESWFRVVSESEAKEAQP